MDPNWGIVIFVDHLYLFVSLFASENTIFPKYKFIGHFLFSFFKPHQLRDEDQPTVRKLEGIRATGNLSLQSC
jgi:hypothetical protein